MCLLGPCVALTRLCGSGDSMKERRRCAARFVVDGAPCADFLRTVPASNLSMLFPLRDRCAMAPLNMRLRPY